uniref:Uncharacterized protein n=1 Tax=Arundo donax TaxID=35708 RepID=A0A0A9BTU3_ARUDO
MHFIHTRSDVLFCSLTSFAHKLCSSMLTYIVYENHITSTCCCHNQTLFNQESRIYFN